jgi:3-isopropylmalate/(R)-2-methylmalate dehydratase small subunit
LKNGLLPIRQEPAVVDRLQQQLRDQPGAVMTIDLALQVLLGPDGQSYPFSIQPFARHCLLEGIDEIDYTLSQMATIEAFERTLTLN